MLLDLQMLCAGDGAAEGFGRQFGGSNSLPHNPRKVALPSGPLLLVFLDVMLHIADIRLTALLVGCKHAWPPARHGIPCS